MNQTMYERSWMHGDWSAGRERRGDQAGAGLERDEGFGVIFPIVRYALYCCSTRKDSVLHKRAKKNIAHEIAKLPSKLRLGHLSNIHNQFIRVFNPIIRIKLRAIRELQQFIANRMEVELDDFEDGRPITFKTSQDTAQKIKLYKGKKQYKDLLALANSMPNTKQKYLILANANLHLKQWMELADTCDRGLDLADDQDSSDFLNLKGKAMGKLGNFEQKVIFTTRAIEINPKVAAYHRNLGAAYYKLKRYQSAIESHDRAIALEPKHSINYHNKGAAYFRLQQYPNALPCFQKATELDKKQVVSFAWMGDTLKQLGEHQRAKDYYMRAYELSSEQQYKEAAREMQAKINPGKKKGFFARIFE